ncbi:MAG: hypothetical protein ACOCV9_08110 [Marinilabiliaceae bacterium]
MNKTFNFIFGTAGTAGTMEMVEIFPEGPEEVSTLIMIVIKALISLLGGVLTSRIANLMREKGKQKLKNNEM